MCFEIQCVMALQGHPRSAPIIESTCAISYGPSMASTVTYNISGRDIIAGFLRRATPPLLHQNFWGV